MEPVDFRISPSMLPLVEQLMVETGARDTAMVFNEALSLLRWAVAEVQGGRKVAGIDEVARCYTVINMSALRVAAKRGSPKPALRLVPKEETA